MDNYDLEKAHSYSNSHNSELEKARVCGCFYCLEIFNPTEINEWINYDNSCDELGTAICPKCGVDSVIAESLDLPITKRFLYTMHRRWFGKNDL